MGDFYDDLAAKTKPQLDVLAKKEAESTSEQQQHNIALHQYWALVAKSLEIGSGKLNNNFGEQKVKIQQMPTAVGSISTQFSIDLNIAPNTKRQEVLGFNPPTSEITWTQMSPPRAPLLKRVMKIQVTPEGTFALLESEKLSASELVQKVFAALCG